MVGVGVGVKVFPLGGGCLEFVFFGRGWLGLRLDIIIIVWVGVRVGIVLGCCFRLKKKQNKRNLENKVKYCSFRLLVSLNF